MPCYDERNSPSYIYEHELKPVQNKLKKLEAVLCGILSLHSLKVLDRLDYKEMGVTRQWIENWWRDHQEEDRRRIAREKQERTRNLERKYNELHRFSAEETVRRLKKELGA